MKNKALNSQQSKSEEINFEPWKLMDLLGNLLLEKKDFPIKLDNLDAMNRVLEWGLWKMANRPFGYE